VLENEQARAIILIIADDEEIRDGMRALLELDGYRTFTARDVVEGIDLAARKPPDLIVMTLGQSPDNVTAGARQVRLRAGLSESVPVVLFSIATLPEGAEVEVGRTIYATRPDNFEQLRAMLARLLGPPTLRP
jgi:DNA-binding response OmpR family regulator